MEEGLHPNRFELDSVSTVNPIMLSHFSGHIVVANSLAL
jgi:predicted amidohydrolase YtcJ